ncbi:hypothetical protein KKF86_08290 [bacterium]|nr:hypothetical protein [bacterium]
MSKGITLIILLLFSLISCKDNTINSQATINKPQIDGVLDEWDGRLFSLKGEKLGFGVMNDDSTLYIAMTTYDKQTIMQVLRGLTIWIDPNSKKDKSFGIKYPIESDMAGFMDITNRNSNQNEDFEFFISQKLLQQNSIQFIKDDILQYGDIDNGENGVQAKIFYNNGEMNYELKVPFSSYISGASEKISIGFESTQMQRPNGSSSNNLGKSQGGLGGGMSGGGKSVGQRPGGMQGKMQGTPQSVNIWLNIKLNTEKG